MTFIDPDSEGALEANTIRLFESLGWEAANCYHETLRSELHAGPGDDRAGRAGVAAQGRSRKAESRRVRRWPSISPSMNSQKTEAS